MIVYEGIGNLFNLVGEQQHIQTLTCTVNTVGAMGAGVALAFKERCPGLLDKYRRALKAGELRIDKPVLFGPYNGKMVLCLATKEHWVNDSKPEYIEAGLSYLAKHWEDMGITSLALPALGCGNGRLVYGRDVQPLIYRYLGDLMLPVSVFLDPKQRRTTRIINHVRINDHSG